MWTDLFLCKRSPPLSLSSGVSVLFFVRDLICILILAIPALVASAIWKMLPKRKKNLKDKVVLVTGAGNGLGRELAIQLSKLGCVVICVDINESDNEETLKKILSQGGVGKAYRCDVAKVEETKVLAERVLDDFGGVDILINNAGIIFRNGMLAGEDKDIVKVVQVNFMSHFWMTRAFLPNMINKSQGHIVCISSSAGIHSLAHGNVYSSTKFALLGMSYSMIEELRADKNCRNIKVSCVLPYFIDTNVQYKGFWKIRLPALSKEEAASSVITGIRKEYMFFTIPGMEFGYHMSTYMRLLPNPIYHAIRDLFYADFTASEEETTKL